MTRLTRAGLSALSLVFTTAALVFTTAALVFTTAAAYAQQADERAGTCRDAKLQMEYFCDASRAATDTMVATGTACENAKKNVAAACEGKVEADKAYKFDKGQ